MDKLILAGVTAIIFIAVGCRGTVSNQAPIHINPNMDRQERLDPQAASVFFDDGRAMRLPVPGTVARGLLREDATFYQGRTSDGSFVDAMPLPLTREVLERGRERYNIFCTPCHGVDGAGKGPIISGEFGYIPAPTYHSDRLRTIEDGYLYNVIANGFQNMPSYAQQIPVADRWAIVSYIRALQKSQRALEGDIPASVLAEIQSAGN